MTSGLQNSVWVKLDVGRGFRSENENGDCQIRALMTARGMKFDEAYDLLYALQGKYRTIGFHICKFLDLEPETFGVKRKISCAAVRGEPRMTAEMFAVLHPKGTYIFKMAHHVACMEDGRLFDRWDSSQKCIYNAWEIK
jgi:hypothetical protein